MAGATKIPLRARLVKRLTVLIAVLALSAAACSSDSSESSGASSDASLLLVLRGQAQAHGGTLTIHTDDVEWFTDQPEHRAGVLPLASVERGFEFEASSGDRPNAAVVGNGLDVVVEISKAELVDDGVALHVNMVRGELPEGGLGSVDVFVDDVTTDTESAVNDAVAAQPEAPISCRALGPNQGDLSDTIICDIQPTGHSIEMDDVVQAADATATAAFPDATVTDETTMWIQAWGGHGDSCAVNLDPIPPGAACNTMDGDYGGVGGFAQTVTTPQKYEEELGTEELWYWISDQPATDSHARAGGASTIVAGLEPSTGNYLTTSNGLVLVAGGGGSGSDFTPGNQGGYGGIAISTSTAPGSGAGQAGTTQNGGQGGNQKGDGGGGAGGSSDDDGGAGATGIGGEGGRSASDESGYVGWIGGGPVLDPNATGIGGEGADGPSHDGSGGGGGYGGGGGGGGTNFSISGNTDGAGGGGGSWARISSVCDTKALTPSTESPNSGKNYQGALRIIFDLKPEAC